MALLKDFDHERKVVGKGIQRLENDKEFMERQSKYSKNVAEELVERDMANATPLQIEQAIEQLGLQYNSIKAHDWQAETIAPFRTANMVRESHLFFCQTCISLLKLKQ